MKSPDIDIDFPTTFSPEKLFPEATRAMIFSDNALRKHNCGIYFQNIPKDEMSNLAAIPYDVAAEYGYQKIDFLHLSILDSFHSKQQIRQLVNTEPDWGLLSDPSIVDQLFQIKNHFDVVSTIKPKSIQELADIIALIRPGKRILLKDYISNRERVRPLLYRQKSEDKSSFKRSHAIAYAHVIVMQLHQLSGK